MKKLIATVLVVITAICAVTFIYFSQHDNKTIEVKGVSKTLITSKAPEELKPKDVIYAFLQKQSEFNSYKIETTGAAVAHIIGGEYKQEVKSTIYKSGVDYLLEASSSAKLVNMKHQAFCREEKVAYRDAFEGNLTVADKNEYKKTYGFTSNDITLGGYIINENTLLNATLENKEDDTLTYHITLAGDESVKSGTSVESATAAVRLQSRAYGSLDNLPLYSDVDLRLTIKNDWSPLRYVSSCSYDAKKIVTMSVKQDLISIYSDVNKEVEIPNIQEYYNELGL